MSSVEVIDVASDSDSDAKTVPLSGSPPSRKRQTESDEPGEDKRKRQKSEGGDGGRDSETDGCARGAGGSPSPSGSGASLAFYLNHVRDFDNVRGANEGVSLKISDIIEDRSGTIEDALLMNYMVDLPWLVEEVSQLP
uniref:Uncharacterized protein n=1 Tax=Chromera velia CCMP2878 TaxID=1169474 RepID=A0A0G4IFC6_9ALVE|eukprot:Cvel_13993.t1-p1 / transcript=Cvel_13993.t1 / gene=Cvel_13993 / organism=Chromera_velia_CCMP2878 / gene_product=hypothetical protein / transcript_product=hypothetical protein / location=Cvel_scaffold978:34728-36127(-) / protein_length=137 / sequence_SO=supercontig / SO=protein_coding / is_pseudo=false